MFGSRVTSTFCAALFSHSLHPNDWNKIHGETSSESRAAISGALFAVRLISRRRHRVVVSPVPCPGSLPKARSIVRPGTGNTHPYNRRGVRPNITGGRVRPWNCATPRPGALARAGAPGCE